MSKVVYFLIIFLIIVPYILFSYGYLTFKCYTWFLLPIFPILPQLSMLQILGATIAINCIKGIKISTEKQEDDLSYLAQLVLLPWFMFIIAYIIHQNI